MSERDEVGFISYREKLPYIMISVINTKNIF